MSPSTDAVLMMLALPRLDQVRERGAARPEDRVEVRGDREVPVVLGACRRAGPTSAPRRCCRGCRAGRSARSWPRTIASQSARRETSAWTAMPLLPAASTSATVSPAPSSLMSATTMRAPCSANSTDAARP